MLAVLLPLNTEVAAEAAELAAAETAEDAAVGRSETVMPAAAQTFARAGASASCRCQSWQYSWELSIYVPAASSLLHFWGAHEVREFVMASRPVVHWQVTSVAPHPEAGSAATKQGICGRPVR
jgi:hypothetical protein